MSASVTGAEVLPTSAGFNIEDPDGNVVGVLIKTASGSSFLMDSTNLWPDKTLTLIPVASSNQLAVPSSTTNYVAAEAFSDTPTSGTPSLTRSRRYLLKDGAVVLACMSVDPAAGPGARNVQEFGHPALDDRLVAYNGNRYVPDHVLTLEVKSSTFQVNWSSHRQTV